MSSCLASGRLLGVRRLVVAFVLFGTSPLAFADPATVSGDAVIRAAALGSEIKITTTSRLAGAIHSLTWNGKEFIDSVDHGRQLQSASNFDAGSPITNETYNPTEAGSVHDGAGPKSSSRLLHLVRGAHWLQTSTQMAFWLPPGGASSGKPAKNQVVLSNHLLTKRVTIGYRDLPNVVEHNVTFHLPLGERHHHAVLESLTGYMPDEFQHFFKFNPATQRLEPLSLGPGEQPLPVVLSVASGSHAMGIFTPTSAKSHPKMTGPGYGRFRFAEAKVNKWNCVFRVIDREHPIPAGEISFRHFVVVGNQDTVAKTLSRLHEEFASEP